MGGLLLAAAALWVSSRMTWSYAVFGAAGMPLPRSETGSQDETGLVPLAVLAVAGVGGTLATGGWARRVVGVVLALAGLVAAWLGVAGLPGVFGPQPDGYPRAEILSARGLAVLAGVAIVYAGVTLVRAGHRMPRLGGSYRTPAEVRRSRDTQDNRSAGGSDKHLWEALSDGEDPTARED